MESKSLQYGKNILVRPFINRGALQFSNSLLLNGLPCILLRAEVSALNNFDNIPILAPSFSVTTTTPTSLVNVIVTKTTNKFFLFLWLFLLEVGVYCWICCNSALLSHRGSIDSHFLMLMVWGLVAFILMSVRGAVFLGI